MAQCHMSANNDKPVLSIDVTKVYTGNNDTKVFFELYYTMHPAQAKGYWDYGIKLQCSWDNTYWWDAAFLFNYDERWNASAPQKSGSLVFSRDVSKSELGNVNIYFRLDDMDFSKSHQWVPGDPIMLSSGNLVPTSDKVKFLTDSITFNNSGETYKLADILWAELPNIVSVEYSSSNSNIVSITKSDGIAKAVGYGTVTGTAKIKYGNNQTATVTIKITSLMKNCVGYCTGGKYVECEPYYCNNGKYIKCGISYCNNGKYVKVVE